MSSEIKCPFKVGNRIIQKDATPPLVAIVTDITDLGFKFKHEGRMIGPHLGTAVGGECYEAGFYRWELTAQPQDDEVSKPVTEILSAEWLAEFATRATPKIEIDGNTISPSGDWVGILKTERDSIVAALRQDEVSKALAELRALSPDSPTVEILARNGNNLTRVYAFVGALKIGEGATLAEAMVAVRQYRNDSKQTDIDRKQAGD